MYDLENKIVAEVKVNPDKKGFFSFGKAKTTMNFISGGIYEVTDKFIYKFQKLKPKYF